MVLTCSLLHTTQDGETQSLTRAAQSDVVGLSKSCCPDPTVTSGEKMWLCAWPSCCPDVLRQIGIGSGRKVRYSTLRLGRKSRNNAHHFLSSKVLVLLGATASLRLPHSLSRTRLRLRKQARMSLKIFTVVSASVFDTRSNPTYEEPHEFQTSPANHRKQRRGSQACRFSARNFR